jgi:hypothetical protein
LANEIISNYKWNPNLLLREVCIDGKGEVTDGEENRNAMKKPHD